MNSAASWNRCISPSATSIVSSSFDLPDNVTAASLSLAVNESGLVATKAIVLLTPEDMDKASKKKVHFRGPGKKAPS
jgi:hypothetical protein